MFERKWRALRLTERGQMVFRYADEIFSPCNQLAHAVRGNSTENSIRLSVGVPDVLPTLVTYWILTPVLEMGKRVKLVCYEGKLKDLLTDLAMHRLDVVLADSQLTPELNVRGFNHLLGQCDVSVFGTAAMAKKYTTGFPKSLEGAPMLFPTQNTTLRRSLEQWFDSQNIRPDIVHEIEDSALLKVFGQAGEGMVVVPTAISDEVASQYSLKPIGRIPEIIERFYAISVERRLKHPAVVAIRESARENLFREP